MKNLPPLYHWSPAANRVEIMAAGLRPTCPTRDGTLCVCLSTDPASGLALLPREYSGRALDLYQVHVADGPVTRCKHWGRVAEIRVPRLILPAGVVLLATRAG